LPDNFRDIGATEIADHRQYLQALIQSGLRAELQMQSLVTGQLIVNIDFFPDAPLKLIGSQRIDLGRDVMELPTIPSPIQKIHKTLEEVPIGEIAKRINDSLKAIENILTSQAFAESLQYFKQTMKNTQDLTQRLDEKFDPLADDLEQTLKDVQTLIRNVDSHVDPLAASIKNTADAARPALEEAEKALANIATLTDKGSEERKKLDRTLKEFQAAARAIKVLAEYLERHPEALIHGKGKSKRR
jgi:paraquat-inducible protein B